ncbi:hypothetical protein OJAV_G00077580 [Oryzias javanicus]|uniref:AIG1-type G domain-containing protein n=1 Tax=Oryzias javanicus TaxID=123683 RepID=A0A437D2X0_ORYJA|nr:hypothetical protein OJAV_G00077580 [Oryzias javanicus]
MGDWLGVKTVEERIESEKELQWLVNKCENRYHVLNNLERNNKEQVKVLLEKIDEMWAENDDPYYEGDQRRAAEMETLREDADKRAKKMKKIFERQSRVLKELFKGERRDSHSVTSELYCWVRKDQEKVLQEIGFCSRRNLKKN